MTDAPYTKLSRRLAASGVLARLGAKGKAAALWLFFAVEQDERGMVEATYEQMMQGTGIKSAATIAGLIDHLDTCGLIRRLDPDPDRRAGRYQMLGDWTRYRQPGAPEGTSKTVVTGGDTLETEVRDTSKTEVTLRESVVGSLSPDSEENPESHPESGTTTNLRDTSKTEVPLDPRLQKLKLPFGAAQLRAWINEYGLEAVVTKARWYHYEHARGGADTPGWLRAAIERGWDTPPAGFDEGAYLSHEERAERWRRDAEKYGYDT